MKIRAADVKIWMVKKRGVNNLIVALPVLLAMILNGEIDRSEIEKEIREFKKAA